MQEATKSTYVEDAETGEEREIELTFHCYPEERQTRMHPGCPAEQELVKAVYTDTGDMVPDEVIARIDTCDLGSEAAQNQSEYEEEMRGEALARRLAWSRAAHRRKAEAYDD